MKGSFGDFIFYSASVFTGVFFALLVFDQVK